MLGSHKGPPQRPHSGSSPGSGSTTALPRSPSSSPVPQQQEARHADLDQQGDAVVFWWQGRRTAVIRDHNGLLLEQLPSNCWYTPDRGSSVKYVPYSEILCCRYLPIRRYCSTFSSCQRQQRHYMELQVLCRHPSRPWHWGIERLELAAEQAELVKDWVRHTRQQLRALPYRPQRLLVFVNPFGGKRQARRTWTKLAEPILSAAGVQCDLVETQHQGHAEELVCGLTLEQLQELDGIVAVGGDGLFAELLTAVLRHKHLTAALQLRLGHIPAGSTDAVACTLHGTRDAVTAALHIALGDCTALDVGRMVALPPAEPAEQQQQQQQQEVAAAPVQQHAAGPVGAQTQQQSAAAGAAVVWDAGMSVGSQSELLLGAADLQQADGLASVPPNSNSRQQRRQQQKHLVKQQQQEKSHDADNKQQQQQQPQEGTPDVQLHIPQLRHFVCVANYGFLGDVMELSERLRWCGPMRYDIAGALRFLMLRQYKATVWYKPAPVHTADGTAAAEPTSPPAAAGGAQDKQQPAHKQTHKTTKQQQTHRRTPSDTLVSPAAVSPLPHHRAPALHARLSPSPGVWQQPWGHQQPQLEQQQQPSSSSPTTQLCCEHSASHLLPDDVDDDDNGSTCSSSDSSSSSRRSCVDLSGPLLTVTEGGGIVVGDAVTPATRAAGAAALTPRSVLLTADSSSEVVGTPSKSQQQGPKSVSFLPQLAAAVHASAASFSSRASGGTAGSAGGAGAAVAGAASRASSVTSMQSSRCHSRCSRCSAAAMHRSASRQTFAALTGAADGGAAAGDAGAARSSEGGGGSSPTSSRPSSTSGGGDGVVHVTPVPPAGASGRTTTAPAAAPAAAGTTTSSSPAAAGAGSSGGGGASSSGSPPGPGWVKVEGNFSSIMCVVTSCISDKSRQGLMPEAHLADGRLALVMVEGCSRLQYLRFLIQLASRGIVPGSLPFVKVEYATEVQVESEGRPSSWNVDGELLRHGRVNVGIHGGLVDVFARGVELM